MGRFVRQQGRDQSPDDAALDSAGVEEAEAPPPFNVTRDVIEPLASGPAETGMTYIDCLGVIERRSFAAIVSDASRWATILRAHGLVQGDRLLVRLGRTPAWHSVVLGALKAGLVAVPCSENVSASELDVRAAHSGAKVIVTDGEHAGEVEMMKAGVDVLLAEGATYAQPDPSAVEASDTVAEDPALILYVSRPGDEPKGVVHTHGSIAALALQAEHWLDAHPDDVVWCTDELGSARGMRNLLFGPWSRGAQIVIHESGFEAEQHFDLMERLGVTILCLAPDEYRALAELPDPVRRGAHSVRHAVSEGIRLDPGAIDAFRDAFGLTILEGYARPETALLSANMPHVGMRSGSVGVPLPGYEVAVIDEDGQELPVGVEGEIAVRGQVPSMFSGYWMAPYATDTVFRGEWYVPGDRATRTDDGFLWLQDDAETAVPQVSSDEQPSDAPGDLEAPAPTAIVREPPREDPTTDRLPDEQPTTPAEAELAPSAPAVLKLAEEVAPQPQPPTPTPARTLRPQTAVAARARLVPVRRPDRDAAVEDPRRVPSLASLAPTSAMHDDPERDGDETALDEDLFERLRAYGRPEPRARRSG